MKKFARIVFWILISLIAIYSTIFIIQKLIFKEKTPSIFGYKNYIVLSGSMEPTINIGDIVIVKDSKDIEEKDIIAFKINDSIVTHRVIEVIEEDKELKYKTKGDANSGEDSDLLSLNDIEGKYVFKIPKLGSIILFLRTPLGLLILGTMLILCLYLSNTKKENEDKDD